MGTWKQAWHDLRSGIALKFLSWAIDIAPMDEKLSIAVAITWHIERGTRWSDQMRAKARELGFNLPA